MRKKKARKKSEKSGMLSNCVELPNYENFQGKTSHLT